MTKLSPGEALSAAGLILAGITLLESTGPGFGPTLKSNKADDAVRVHLRSAEATTTAALLLAGVIASVLIRAAWPLLVSMAAAVFAISVHEAALRAGG